MSLLLTLLARASLDPRGHRGPARPAHRDRAAALARDDQWRLWYGQPAQEPLSITFEGTTHAAA